MNPTPDLSVIVPMHNAAAHIETLVRSIVQIESLDVECIVVDDASTDDSRSVLERLDAELDALAVVHLDENVGAGVARNTGFERARGRYTLFFDADDILHPDALVAAIESLDRTNASMAMLPYRYRRGVLAAHEEMNEYDVEVWDQVTAGRSVSTVLLSDVPALLGFSNYPWNKVLRTEHYRRSGLRFSATPVHNDILGHWHTLLFADTIDLVDEPLCTHIVTTSGNHLSNRESRDRLALFDALDDTYDLLCSRPDLLSRYTHHFWSLSVRIGRWARSRLAEDHVNEFNARRLRHIRRMSISELAVIRSRRVPSLAKALYEEATR